MSNGCEVFLALGMHICSVLSPGVDDTSVKEHQRSCTHLSAPIGRTFEIEVYRPRIIKIMSRLIDNHQTRWSAQWPGSKRRRFGLRLGRLDRSKSLPLQVDSESPDDLSDDEDPPAELSNADLEKLFTFLVPHVPRWGSIDVHVTSYEHMYTFLKTLSDPSVPPASQLQVLRLYHHEEFDGHITRFPESDFSDHFTLFNGSAPRLQNVSLWGVHVDWTQSWLHSPNLVELELAYHTPDVRPDWPTFSAMLRATAPTLEKLCLESSGPSGSPYEWIVEPDTPEWNVDANSPILLPKLIQLELAFIPPLEVISLLRKLCMPSLKVLALNFDDGDYTDLVTYLARPKYHYRCYQSYRCHLNDRTATQSAWGSRKRMYNELVNLEALNLSMNHLPSPFFGNLHPQPTPTLEGSGPFDTTVSYRVLLPRLTTLFVSDVPGGLVRRFVHERQWVGAPLRMVFVEEDTYVKPEDECWLKENLEKFDYFEGSDDEDEYEEESLPSDYMSYEEWDADDDWLESGSE
ncbi:hypothetical protein EDD15DRAFT_2517080 [Pisolithus albus]|nr:hypothetical protein EDD15DRAFT_2517080 [Pisolithus albus]